MVYIIKKRSKNNLSKEGEMNLEVQMYEIALPHSNGQPINCFPPSLSLSHTHMPARPPECT